MKKEIWRDVIGYEGFYQVSDEGRVKSLPRTTKMKNGKIYKTKRREMSIHINNRGYPAVRLTAKGRSTIYLVHRLVAMAFMENPENKAYVNHIDGVKNNNLLGNLEWSTPVENSLHAWETGLCKPTNVGESHRSAKLTENEVKYIRNSFYSKKKTRKELAGMFGITPQSTGDIINYKTWKHIN